MTLTITEAADVLGISARTIRSWYDRGNITPVTVGVHPLRFYARDILACQAARVSNTKHTRLDTLWAQVVASTPSDA